MKIRSGIIAALTLAAGSTAMADTVTAKFSIPWNPGNNTSFAFVPAGGGSPINLSEPAVIIKGVRTDLPVGPGETPLLNQTFYTFCTEVSENINVTVNGGGGNTYTFQVLPLLGSSTSSAAVTGVTTFDALRTSRLERLWADLDVAKAMTDPTYSAAFQVAQWKIAFESKAGSLNLLDNTSRMAFGAPNAINVAAQAMLDQVDLPGTHASLVLLRADGVQDQITMVVPAPGAAGLAVLGGLLVVGRRRRV